MIENGKYYIVTSDTYFYGPNGYQFKAAWGVAKVLSTEDVFKFTPNRPSTNWFVKLGEGEKSVIIAGCQIHCAIECKERPTEREGSYEDNKSSGLSYNLNYIYFTE